MTYWKENISTMISVKQELMRRDIDQVWPHHFPEIAASEEEISEMEKELKVALTSNYREFLQFANGWKGFYQTVDLFGTNELNHSAKMSYAKSQLQAIEKDVLKQSGNDVNQLLPIAVSESDLDLFALCLTHSPTPGKVIWFAGEVIDSFENFNEFFLAMIDYNREEIAALDTVDCAVFQFLAGNFHQDIESPEDALQELLTEESKEYLKEAIIFLTDFLNSSYSENEKNEYIQSCTDGIYFSTQDITPINWLSQVIGQIEEAVRNSPRGKNN